MPSSTTVTLHGYLKVLFKPDCEYVDGMLVERNLGDDFHSGMQAALLGYLGSRQKMWNIRVRSSQRMQVSSTRIRVPDVSVVLQPARTEPIISSPPFICIEVLSEADTIEEMQQRIDDYVAFGVQNIWLLSPRLRRAFVHTGDGRREVKDGILRTLDPEISLPLAEIFAE
jgi:Uma2 family endonuclease